ncbi:MAG: rod shape-determining protein MreC [Parcubacteria group bacterium LiPW_39]|nr:MAG: rod shape-determining protein MreC [Parcubacteria group bacterium LiPW_39]
MKIGNWELEIRSPSFNIRNFIMRKKIFLKSFGTFFVVLAVILLLIFFHFKGWLAIPKDAVYFISAPFLKFWQQTGDKISGVFNFLLTIKNLDRENYFLREENRKLFQENTDLKEAVQENKLLRQRLALGEPAQRQLVLAKVVGYNPQLGQYFLIDKGSAAGLVPDLAAVTANNFLVGKIVQVNRYSAKVMLISDSSSLVNAITQETRVNGVVKGSHGLAITMEMLPADQKINKGEIVLSSGLNDAIPRDLIIGRITEVILKESEIFQKATLQPATDFKKLESVFIIVK